MNWKPSAPEVQLLLEDGLVLLLGLVEHLLAFDVALVQALELADLATLATQLRKGRKEEHGLPN